MKSIISDIIRSACECERPEKHDTDTVELSVSDLREILERHLSAAAPDLLQVLCSARARLSPATDPLLCADIDAAIAKATGAG